MREKSLTEKTSSAARLNGSSLLASCRIYAWSKDPLTFYFIRIHGGDESESINQTLRDNVPTATASASMVLRNRFVTVGF